MIKTKKTNYDKANDVGVIHYKRNEQEGKGPLSCTILGNEQGQK
jgi:hypothetical protein